MLRECALNKNNLLFIFFAIINIYCLYPNEISNDPYSEISFTLEEKILLEEISSIDLYKLRLFLNSYHFEIDTSINNKIVRTKDLDIIESNLKINLNEIEKNLSNDFLQSKNALDNKGKEIIADIVEFNNYFLVFLGVFIAVLGLFTVIVNKKAKEDIQEILNECEALKSQIKNKVELSEEQLNSQKRKLDIMLITQENLFKESIKSIECYSELSIMLEKGINEPDVIYQLLTNIKPNKMYERVIKEYSNHDNDEVSRVANLLLVEIEKI